MTLKISQRLQQIDRMVSAQYDHIWDCCCDHGLLGLRLLERRAATTVHFVDVVAPLMAELQRFWNEPPESPRRWQVHCIDVAQLRLPTQPAAARHLIIIAGVGGELLIDLVDALRRAHPRLQLEFLLCPVRHSYKVRRALAALDLGLVNECLVQDNQRFYEVIHVATRATRPVVAVGSLMWDLSDAAHQAYLARTIEHYRRTLQGAQADVAQAVAEYQALQAGGAPR